MKRREFVQRAGALGIVASFPTTLLANTKDHESLYLTTITPLDTFREIRENSTENFLKKHGHFERLEDLLPTFVRAGEDFDIDSRYLLGHFCLETGYGQSGEWKRKNNGFGIGSFDNEPHKAHVFESPKDGVYKGAEWIANNYIHGGRNTKTLQEMHAVPYATHPEWANNIAWIGRRFS